MAGNINLTPTLYGKMILFNLGGMLNVVSNMSHEVTKEFREKPGGNMPGSKVLIRKPYRFEVKQGLHYQPQPTVDQQTPVTLNRVAQVSYDWNSYEKTLTARRANELYAEPAALAIASDINRQAATFLAQSIFNSVGTVGTAPTTQATYLSAGDLLVAQGMPDGELSNTSLIINRRMSSAFVNGMTAVFNPQAVISSQLEKGEIVKRLMGYKIFQDQTINRHTVGTYAGTILVNGANQTADGGNNGTMTLITDGHTSGVSTFNRGDKFVIGNASVATVSATSVNSVHPQTRVDTGYQQWFTVVNTITDTAGAMSVVVSPAITPSGQYQNVNQAPVDNAIITVVGTAGATGDQALLIHKNAAAFVSVPLSAPEDGEGAKVTTVTDDRTGVSLRIIKSFDYRESEHIHRIDVLWDVAMLYREMGVVIQG